MKEIVGVRFKSVGKIYYFSPGDLRLTVGDRVIVETVRGESLVLFFLYIELEIFL